MECEVQLQGGDLHADMVTETADPVLGHNFATMEETESWLNTDQDDILCVNDPSMFYAEFPPLPDFPCMSSSSSSSSTPALPPCSTTTPSSSSSSSASSSSAPSWAVLRSDVCEEKNSNYSYYMQQHDQSVDAHATQHAALSSTASMEIPQQHHGLDGMDDVMDTFGYMELIDTNDFFDPASIFQDEENHENPLGGEGQIMPQQDQEQHAMVPPHIQVAEEDNKNNLNVTLPTTNEMGGGGGASASASAGDEMSMVFLEWLKSNKDSVSANDLRNVKLKKSTIESAARRLGGGKEGMKQLLKLILEWVQTSHLHNKKRKENPLTQFQDLSTPNHQNNTTNRNSFVPESCFNQSTTPWIPQQQPYNATEQSPMMGPPSPYPQPMVGYVGEPCNNMLESAQTWPPSQFPVSHHHYNNQQPFGDTTNLHPPVFSGYGNQYPYQFFHGPGDGLVRLGPSATKEARKKRMARQKRILPHQRHHHNSHTQNQGSDAGLGGDNCTNGVVAAHANQANWVYWQTMAGGAANSTTPLVPAESPAGQHAVDRTAMQTQNYHPGRVSTDRRQVCGP